MLNGYRNGIITEARLHDALRRILGLKVKLHFPEKQQQDSLTHTPSELDVIGATAHQEMQQDVADLGITLDVERITNQTRHAFEY
ncbi:hypothetical protein [Staphylococcus agnetis]|uniref:hypothetical protein n=1 Tax=Staphylococcus agnetis TaxID=985762 RepID=UPI0021BD35EA|nr:hypothetical protein [Staphylococcus agnetis]